jgi:hypothetical protein
VTTTHGKSITRGYSTNFTATSGITIGGSKQEAGAWPTSTKSKGSSIAGTASVAEGRTDNYSETESTSTARAAQSGTSVAAGGSETDTENWSDAEGSSRTITNGTTTSEGDSVTRTEGVTNGHTVTKGDTAGKTVTYTERRRMMTADEVRQMPKNATLLFIERLPECLVERMHYHKLAPLVARVLEGQIAFGPPED